MNKLIYARERWEGTLQRDDGETIHIHMSDTTLRKHYHAYLESIGVSTQSYQEMLAHLQQVHAQQFQAWQHILELEPWLTCTDPDVRILCILWHTYADRSSRTLNSIP
ncbi:MAG TPA: hypothetical protein VGN15_08505 [Ktedonobacteraceae bacterium]|nr:hypothetical protein [Ktedonobacteraceae bacterium]